MTTVVAVVGVVMGAVAVVVVAEGSMADVSSGTIVSWPPPDG